MLQLSCLIFFQRVTNELSRVRSDKELVENRLREAEENTVTSDLSTHTEQEWVAASSRVKVA